MGFLKRRGESTFQFSLSLRFCISWYTWPGHLDMEMIVTRAASIYVLWKAHALSCKVAEKMATRFTTMVAKKLARSSMVCSVYGRCRKSPPRHAHRCSILSYWGFDILHRTQGSFSSQYHGQLGMVMSSASSNKNSTPD